MAHSTLRAQAKAEQDGEEWIVNGQMVWTSGGHIADLGMLIARTNFEVPKHQGISCFAIKMDQPGVDVGPLREMTGRALFNEVFMDDARVADNAMISDAMISDGIHRGISPASGGGFL